MFYSIHLYHDLRQYGYYLQNEPYDKAFIEITTKMMAIKQLENSPLALVCNSDYKLKYHDA